MGVLDPFPKFSENYNITNNTWTPNHQQLKRMTGLNLKADEDDVELCRPHFYV